MCSAKPPKQKTPPPMQSVTPVQLDEAGIMQRNAMRRRLMAMNGRASTIKAGNVQAQTQQKTLLGQ